MPEFQIDQGEGVAAAEIDSALVSKIRQEMPVNLHRRHDLYGLVTRDNVKVLTDDSRGDQFQFGQFEIPAEQVVSICLPSLVLRKRNGFCISQDAISRHEWSQRSWVAGNGTE